MAQNDAQARILVEQSGAHQTQGMDGGLLTERPCRPQQPFVALIDPGILREWIARMQIKGHIELFDLGPERPIAIEVIIGNCPRVSDLGEAVHKSALEAESVDRAVEFGDCQVRILHRECRERLKAVGTLCNLFGQIVVGANRDFVRLSRVRDRLHRRGIERENHHLDALLVHLAQPLVLDVQQTLLELGPIAVRHETRGIHQRFRNCKMLLECDLALHRHSPCAFFNIALAA